MDKFIEKLAQALKDEFPFLNGPSTAPDAFQKAAGGIVEKMGLMELRINVTNPSGTEIRHYESYIFEEQGPAFRVVN
jgi:hypothetical protein